MSDSLFEIIADALEESTTLSRLEARGTLRLACKQAGIDPKRPTPHQLEVVLERLMPGELEARGIENAQAVCTDLAARAAGFEETSESQGDAPEDVFGRMSR